MGLRSGMSNVASRFDLATAIFKGDVFGTWNIASSDFGLITTIFLPIAGMSPEDKSELVFSQCHIYEFLDKAGPSSINGYPMFMSCKVIYPKEFKKVARIVWWMIQMNKIARWLAVQCSKIRVVFQKRQLPAVFKDKETKPCESSRRRSSS